MSAEQTPDIETVLAEHGVSAKTPGDTACRCDRRWRSDADYRAHVAQALAPVLAAAVREAEQRALREAANERVNPNDSTTAYRFYSEQRRWLRLRADRITEPASHEAATSGKEASKA